MDATQTTPLPHVSTASLMRAAETEMVARYAQQTGRATLQPGRVTLPGGSSVQVAGIGDTEQIYVAACPRVSALTSEDLPAVAQSVFTLSLLRSAHPHAEVVLLFAGEPARQSTLNWVRAFHGHQVLDLQVVELDAAWTSQLAHAQRGNRHPQRRRYAS